jgi:hypothetical protein
MNKKINNVSSVFLLMALIIVTFPVINVPVSAKDMNLPSGANRIVYYTGGNATINLPAGLPNYPPSATKIRLDGVYVKGGTPETGVVNIWVWLYMTTSSKPVLHWEPMAIITTNPEMANFMRTCFKGTYIAFDATAYGLPSSYNTNNVILVDKADVGVEREGNNIYVNLAEPQQIQRFGYPTMPAPFTLPAFSMQLNKYGGSVHSEATTKFSGYSGASGYTMEVDVMAFNGNGFFTCTSPGWNYNAAPMSEAFIIMHGINTYYPPS